MEELNWKQCPSKNLEKVGKTSREEPALGAGRCRCAEIIGKAHPVGEQEGQEGTCWGGHGPAWPSQHGKVGRCETGR